MTLLLPKAQAGIGFPLPRTVLALGVASVLAACGGGGGPSVLSAQNVVPAPIMTGFMTFGLTQDTGPTGGVSPAYHMAAVVLAEPTNEDSHAPDASRHHGPLTQQVPAEFDGLPTRRLTLDALHTRHAQWAAGYRSVIPHNARMPAASAAASVGVYTPAQIRAAYGLPALPPAGAVLTADQAAQLGAGQTIYILDAMHDPNAAAELAAFNTKFGLRSCATQAISPTATMPLSAATSTGCVFSVVYTDPTGKMTSTAPAYDAGWASEIALDVQWAHATAPMARIVLIEASDSGGGLTSAIATANKMGPGVVSMSFGGTESSTDGASTLFSAAGMSYVAATGDSGTGVSWPSSMPTVVAVGGTSLNYTGTGARTETTWSGTGGGVSKYIATPTYQNASIIGLPAPLAHRGVADVAFNADPNTGQYVALIGNGSATVSWASIGGTSLATPQWAGILAIGNALRARTGGSVLGAPHAILYGNMASSTVAYAQNYLDVTQGADGTCALCASQAGYDLPTGLGTPNGANVLASLAGTNAAPVIAATTVTGAVGTALSFTVAATAPHAVTYTLSGAPSGMTLASTTGVITWATPLAGTYPITVTARDATTGLSGNGTITVLITVPQPPLVSPIAIGGTTGVPLSFTAAIVASNPVTVTLSGAPAGMTSTTAGVVTWPTPIKGTYVVTVVATDTKTKLTGSGGYSITIAEPTPPTVGGGRIAGTVGTPLSFNASVSNTNPVTYALAGYPSGMTISRTGVVTWAAPVAGTYMVTVTVKDTKAGLSGQGMYSVVIASAVQAGPAITFTPLTGVANSPLSGKITVTDDAKTVAVTVTITGAPLGMMFSTQVGPAMILNVTWAKPVAGNYTLNVIAVDNLGRTATVQIPITVSTH